MTLLNLYFLAGRHLVFWFISKMEHFGFAQTTEKLIKCDNLNPTHFPTWETVDHFGAAAFVSKFDLLKGYRQVSLTPRAREISAFVTPSGLFSYKVMSFGLRNAPATSTPYGRSSTWQNVSLPG